MKPEDLYHTGIVVEDFEAALRWFNDVAGYCWCDELTIDQDVWTPAGERPVSIRFAYSMSEPHLEVIEALPGTVWVPTSSGAHHLGFWSDDVDRDIEKLVANGLHVEVKAPTPDGSTLWAYCHGPSGPRIELVSRSLEPMMVKWFATGRSPFG